MTKAKAPKQKEEEKLTRAVKKSEKKQIDEISTRISTPSKRSRVKGISM